MSKNIKLVRKRKDKEDENVTYKYIRSYPGIYRCENCQTFVVRIGENAYIPTEGYHNYTFDHMHFDSIEAAVEAQKKWKLKNEELDKE